MFGFIEVLPYIEALLRRSLLYLRPEVVYITFDPVNNEHNTRERSLSFESAAESDFENVLVHIDTVAKEDITTRLSRDTAQGFQATGDECKPALMPRFKICSSLIILDKTSAGRQDYICNGISNKAKILNTNNSPVRIKQ